MPLTQGSGKYIIFLLKAVIYRILVFEVRNWQSRQLSEPFRRAFDFVMVQLNVVGVAEVEKAASPGGLAVLDDHVVVVPVETDGHAVVAGNERAAVVNSVIVNIVAGIVIVVQVQ